MKRCSGGEQEMAGRAAFQRKYIRHLVAVLRHWGIEPGTSLLGRSRAMKLAADLSLATTARGRTAWSRAILRKCLSRLYKPRCQRQSVVKSRVNYQISSSTKSTSRRCRMTFAGKNSVRLAWRSWASVRAAGTVASRIQTLRKLMPGSSRLDTPVLLEEVADYIVALQFQVQSMQSITRWYAN